MSSWYHWWLLPWLPWLWNWRRVSRVLHSDAWRMQRLVPCKGLQGTFCRMLTSIRWPICWHVHCREPILQPKAATATTAATAATAWLIEEIRHGQKSPRRCIERGVLVECSDGPEHHHANQRVTASFSSWFSVKRVTRASLPTRQNMPLQPSKSSTTPLQHLFTTFPCRTFTTIGPLADLQ